MELGFLTDESQCLGENEGHKLLLVDSAKTILIQVASQKGNQPVTQILLILVDH